MSQSSFCFVYAGRRIVSTRVCIVSAGHCFSDAWNRLCDSGRCLVESRQQIRVPADCYFSASARVVVSKESFVHCYLCEHGEAAAFDFHSFRWCRWRRRLTE